jgi:hypothetical protein
VAVTVVRSAGSEVIRERPFPERAVAMDDESISSGEPDLVLIRIRVPELNVEKCLQFQKDEVLWEVKQQSLAALPKVGRSQCYKFIKNSYFSLPEISGSYILLLRMQRRSDLAFCSYAIL